MAILIWHNPSPGHLLMPASDDPQGQHTRCVQPGQVPKAEVTLTSQGQNTHIILTEGKELLIQVPTKYLFS